MYLAFTRRKSFLQCIALEQRESKAKHSKKLDTKSALQNICSAFLPCFLSSPAFMHVHGNHHHTLRLSLDIPTKVVNLKSDTFGKRNFSKVLTKVAFLSDYRCSRMLALSPCCKVPKLDLQSEFSMSKIIQIFLNFFYRYDFLVTLISKLLFY